MSDTNGDGPGPLFDVAVLSDRGKVRPANEDCGRHLRLGDSGVLVVVADGVSGLRGAANASQRAVEGLLAAYLGDASARPRSLGRRLADAVQRANLDVYDSATTTPALHGQATTLTALTIEGINLAAAHVGDSRLYLARGAGLTQLTRDHTVAAGRMRMGLASKRRARQDPGRSVLTRALGRALIVNLDRFERPVQPGDSFLLCTDGLYNALEESEIARIVCARDVSASSTCERLVEAANAAGGEDNVTVSVVRVATPFPSRPWLPPPVRRSPLWRRLLGLGRDG